MLGENNKKVSDISQEKDSNKDCIITADQLIEGKTLVSGAYGDIKRGLYRTHQVVIKKFNDIECWGGSSKISEILRSDIVSLVSLKHKNIAKYYGACIDLKSLCIVMPYYPNSDLMSYLTSSRDITWARRMKIAHGIAKGIKYLHEEANIIHGRLKIANVLLNKHKRPLIADFGLTQVHNAAFSIIHDAEYDFGRNHSGPYLSMPYWLAPEIFDDAPETKAIDIYALGLILNELSTREISFKNLIAHKWLSALNKNEMPQTNNEAPLKLNTLIHLCWLKNPQERPTISQVTKEIKSIRAQIK